MKNAYEIRGDVSAIFLRRRDGTTLEALIDTDDLGALLSWSRKWSGWWSKSVSGYYVRSTAKVDGKARWVYLHRLLMNPPNGMVVDHINGDTLDNRRSNLRVVTNQQNGQNRHRTRSDSKSGVRGVYFHKGIHKWVSYSVLNGKKHHIGCFETVEKAEAAVCQFRKEHMPFSQEATLGERRSDAS